VNRYEKQKKAVQTAMAEHVKGYQGILAKAKDEDDRDFSDDERVEIEDHLKAIENLKTDLEAAEKDIKTAQRVEDIGREIGPALGHASVGAEPEDRLFQRLNEHVWPQAQKTLGETFVSSEQYKKALQVWQGGGRSLESWSTGAVAVDTKGTLLEGAGSPSSGSGGGLIPVPQVVPGVVDVLFQRLTFSDLLLSGQADGNTIRYVVEGTATSGAAGVAEGGAKPESVLGLSTTDERIKKIATLLPVSDEMIEDAPAIQSYINGRLALFVRIEEERQLFRGAAGGNEVQGILTSRGVPVYAGGTAAGNYAVQLFAAMNGMRGSAFVEPDWVVMHPTDYQKVRLLTDTAGQFFGGGPFQGPYGNGSNVQASGQLTGAQDSLWNKPVVVTAGIGGAGTALIGTRANAQVWRKGGVSVESTNSHSTYFANNLVAIRAEERLGLAVYRPSAYVQVNLA
jgi:HK97 family phage major capsid protein